MEMIYLIDDFELVEAARPNPVTIASSPYADEWCLGLVYTWVEDSDHTPEDLGFVVYVYLSEEGWQSDPDSVWGLYTVASGGFKISMQDCILGL